MGDEVAAQSDEHPAGRGLEGKEAAKAVAAAAAAAAEPEAAATGSAVTESKAAAVRVITRAVEAASYPCLASDWEEVEMCCIAMNDHYVEHMQCPREMLMNRNNRVLDPTHYTSLPGKVRLGIRSAMCYGHRFSACFEAVKTADRGHRFMKSVSLRTVILSGHRFIIGWQHTMSDMKTYGKDQGWWKEMEKHVARAAKEEELLVQWVSQEEAEKWAGCEDGAFIQTESLSRKELLDEAVVHAVHDLPFPVLACDPFLPECPVIALNAAAQALTGWEAVVGKAVSEADKRLLEGAKGAARGAYHVNYGLYGAEEGEEQERLSVRAACCNGRPCLARWREMYARPAQDGPGMWLQGATLAQGVNRGPLSGCDVWYLFGILAKEADLAEWRTSAECEKQVESLRSALSNALDPANAPGLIAPVPEQPEQSEQKAHPYGGDVKLLQVPLWHGAVTP